MASHFPEIENVESPLGPVESIWATSATHIGMRGTFTINRVSYNVRLDLHYRDGIWQRGYQGEWSDVYHALMIDRDWDWSKGSRPEPSQSAREKAVDALVPWLAAFAENEGAEIIRQAGIKRHAQDIASKQEQIEKLRAEMATAEAELAFLQEETA